ncbi:MAG: sarcosine oxidase subunit gamma [Woeseiaceae bacterium]
MSESPLRLERVLDVTYINLRGDSQNAELQAIIRELCKAELPTEANTVVGEDCKVFWLGPDEWMLVGHDADFSELAVNLGAKLEGQHVAISDVSGGLVCYHLLGDGARRLLAKGCPLDLHPDVFESGQCAQTGLAKAGVLIRPLPDDSGYDLIVRRSFADYLWQWLLRAGREFKIEVT